MRTVFGGTVAVVAFPLTLASQAPSTANTHPLYVALRSASVEAILVKRPLMNHHYDVLALEQK